MSYFISFRRQTHVKHPFFNSLWIQKWDSVIVKCINVFVELKNKAKFFSDRRQVWFGWQS